MDRSRTIQGLTQIIQMNARRFPLDSLGSTSNQTGKVYFRKDPYMYLREVSRFGWVSVARVSWQVTHGRCQVVHVIQRRRREQLRERGPINIGVKILK